MNPTIDFIHDLKLSDIPAGAIHQAQRCLLDLIGTAAGGTITPVSHIIRNFAVRYMGGGQARLIFDGRRASPGGAALAGGTMIDSMDCHDGHVLVKGHVGVAVFPALLGLIDSEGEIDSREFITSLVIGYEIATRAGIALHSTACDYHSSGSWNALACAALGARFLKLGTNQTRHALGIAEYNGPRSQMMRCIDHPTMVKDGSGWGAMTGINAAYLAADGFTGAPAITVENAEVAEIWADLGTRWRINEQYFKAYPVCRWAQPAIEAARSLQTAHQVAADDIRHVEVFTFHEGTRLATRCPETTEQAQYSLPFPVAAMLTRQQIGAGEVTGDALRDPAILRLSNSMILTEDDAYNARFPAERWAHVAFTLNDGTHLISEPAIARGNPENPLSADEITEKFHLLANPILGADRAQQIKTLVSQLMDKPESLNKLRQLLFDPVTGEHHAEKN